MPPKPKGGVATKKPKVPEVVIAPSEFDALDPDTLRRLLGELRADTEKVSRERNQAQVDRDAVERFYDISKKELREADLAVLGREREMELMAENHRVEVKVYQQKVKHLEYEHAHGMRRLAGREDDTLREEEDGHLAAEAGIRGDKLSLKSRVREMDEANAEAVRHMKVTHEKNLVKLRQEFQANLEQLRSKYEARLSHARDDLRLRHKVEVHEVEERKNLHINQLMKAHEEAFTEMKRYYNDITRANLQLISQLRTQIAEANEKVAANQRLMREIAEQNTRLKDPLEVREGCARTQAASDGTAPPHVLPCYPSPGAGSILIFGAARHKGLVRVARGAARCRKGPAVAAIRQGAPPGARVTAGLDGAEAMQHLQPQPIHAAPVLSPSPSPCSPFEPNWRP